PARTRVRHSFRPKLPILRAARLPTLTSVTDLQTPSTPHKSSDVYNHPAQRSVFRPSPTTSSSSTQYKHQRHQITARSTASNRILVLTTQLLEHYYSETALTPSVAKPPTIVTQPVSQGHPRTDEFMSIENLKSYDPFAEADEDTGETKQSQNYIHIRIQQRNGRKTLTTVQGLPKKFDQKKILKVIKKQFACNGTIVADSEMGEVIQLQGDQRKVVQEFLINTKEGLGLDSKTIKVHGF
ncbi:eukaryotic translation initiation factor eIF-1, partial [Colletotrichum abscissum]|uniref:eukaryotic translation initiation factor eIF-1 n=1 Tax=Colletotrichum abscissum TaxID=1671311 RepID=UPI0027D5A752